MHKADSTSTILFGKQRSESRQPRENKAPSAASGFSDSEPLYGLQLANRLMMPARAARAPKSTSEEASLKFIGNFPFRVIDLSSGRWRVTVIGLTAFRV